MRQGLLQSSRYSPGNMNRESLEALFVGRHQVMEDVLTRLSKSIESPEKHYLLLVGPRGSGKTHLIALAHHRLMDRLDRTEDYHAVLVALLNEEEWGVASFLDLIVRILNALTDQVPNLEIEIGRIYDKFSKDPDEAESFALALLRLHTRDKTLLLFCENLVDIFRGLGNEGQKKWRAVILEDGNWAMVASTPTLFAALTLQDNPFYGFFTIRHLEELDFETALELLVKKAVHENKTDLANFLRTPLGRARSRAIHHLAAGNHRAYVVLFDFLDKESLDDLIPPFMHMVDDLTPYYQDKMRQLPPAQRKIVEFLSYQGKPTSIKDISIPILMSQQTAAKQIGELERAGFVSRKRFGRYTYCELSEPLMRICIEVKDNKTRYFRLFVEFLRHWFTTRELERQHSAFQHDDQTSHVDRIHIEEALSCSHEDKSEPFLDALHEEASRCFRSDDYGGLAKIQQTLSRDGGRAEDYMLWIYALVRLEDSQTAIAVAHEAAAKFPDGADIHYELSHAYFIGDRFDDALAAIDHAIALSGQVPADPAHLCIRSTILLNLERFEEAITDAQAVLHAEPDHWHSFEQIISALVSLDCLRKAEAHARELVALAPTDLTALLIASDFYLTQDRFDEALELLENAIEINSDSERARRMRGYALFQMSDYRRATEDLRLYASSHPHSISTHCWLADSLLLSGNWNDAIDVADHLIRIDREHVHAHYVRGRAFIELNRPEDAVAAFDKLLPTEDHDSLLVAASQIREIGHYVSARRYLERVAELQPDNRELWIQRTRLHIEEGAFDEAAESAKRIRALPGSLLLGRLFEAQATAAKMPLHVALKSLGTVLEPEEFASDERLHLDATAQILTVSLRHFGPKFLPEGLTKLRNQLADLLDDGVLGGILTSFLYDNVDVGFAGSLPDWEKVMERLSSALVDLPDCQIPLQMLRTAVNYTKTGDEKYLLSLPLEQRQLLEDVLLPTAIEKLNCA